jgi:hypothetical protein
VELGRENSSSRWWVRNDGEEGTGAGGDAAALVVVKGWSRESDERMRPKRRRDMGMAGVELGQCIGGESAAGGRGRGGSNLIRAARYEYATN